MLGIGGICTAFFIGQLKDRPLIPLNDPNLNEVDRAGRRIGGAIAITAGRSLRVVRASRARQGRREVKKPEGDDVEDALPQGGRQ